MHDCFVEVLKHVNEKNRKEKPHNSLPINQLVNLFIYIKNKDGIYYAKQAKKNVFFCYCYHQNIAMQPNNNDFLANALIV